MFYGAVRQVCELNKEFEEMVLPVNGIICVIENN